MRVKALLLAAAMATLPLIASCTADPSSTPGGEGKSGNGTDCVVQQVDERGGVGDTSTEPEGAKRGEFRCVDGTWQYSWAPFGPDDFITAPKLQVDPAGSVLVREFDRPERGSDLTLGEMADVARAVTGSKAVVFTRAVVVVDDGRERTAAEVEALLAGRDATGANVLRTIDRLDPESTVDDIVDETGGQGPVVVYLLSGIWDAIKGAVSDALNWAVDGIRSAGEWIHDHCEFFPQPLPGEDIQIVRCEWS